MVGLEDIIITKELMISEHSKTIAQLMEGNITQLKDIKHMFFSK